MICEDNLFMESKVNIEHILNHKRFEFNLSLYGGIFHSRCNLEVNKIYNLLCLVSPIHYQSDSVQTTKTADYGAINMVGLAKRTRARMFQVSTVEVYGDPAVHPQTDSYWGNVNPTGLRACYDERERCAETLFFDYNFQRKLEICVARIFRTYGPRMYPNYDEALQVNDLIEGFIRFMNTPKGTNGGFEKCLL